MVIFTVTSRTAYLDLVQQIIPSFYGFVLDFEAFQILASQTKLGKQEDAFARAIYRAVLGRPSAPCSIQLHILVKLYKLAKTVMSEVYSLQSFASWKKLSATRTREKTCAIHRPSVVIFGSLVQNLLKIRHSLIMRLLKFSLKSISTRMAQSCCWRTLQKYLQAEITWIGTTLGFLMNGPLTS